MQAEPWHPAPNIVEEKKNRMVDVVNEDLDKNQIRVTLSLSEDLI